MNFPNLIQPACISTAPPPPDVRCSDPAFALAHPDICSTSPVLIIAPGIVLGCALGSVQFLAYLSQNGQQTLLTTGLVWSSSDNDIAIIGAISGNATGTGAGTATITATYGELTATATLEVMADGDCCSESSVATMLVLDVSKSMSLGFGSGYATREDYAKSAAARYASETNTDKDTIGLITFDSTATVVSPLTSDKAGVQAAIASQTAGIGLTGIGLALSAAKTALDASSADVKTIVLITDGEDKDIVTADDPLPIAASFKNSGGILIVLGIRAHGTSFNLLNALSTGGFFLNAYPATAASAKDNLSGLKGYTCAGNCVPAGDDFEHKPKLDYHAFTNWDVTGHVDLFGPGLFDLLPGNGLYVNLASNIPSNAGSLTSKTAYTFVAGRQYALSFYLAGNQVADLAGYSVRVQIGGGLVLNQTISMADFEQPFTLYSFVFTVPADTTGKISFLQVIPSGADPVYGSLLDSVTLNDVTGLTSMLGDTFDSENLEYVMPACGPSETVVGYYGYNCESVGCLSTPPGVQQQDPNPQSDLEAGYVPPTTYSSTQTVTVYCPDGSIQVKATTAIPVMTSPTAPSGIVTQSNQISGSEGWKAFGEGTGWSSPDITGWIMYKFPTAKTILGYALTTKDDNNDPQFFYVFSIEGSNDGTNFTTLSQSGVEDSKGETAHRTFTSAATFLYYRLSYGMDSPTFRALKWELFEPATSQGVSATVTKTSTVSQADSINKATIAARAQANADLAAAGCKKFYTSTKFYTAKCSDIDAGTFGNDVTKSATEISYTSQSEADTLATAAAKELAESALVCDLSNNTQSIVITDSPDNTPQKATPFPSVVYVSGKTGHVTHVKVNLLGFSHAFPEDVQLFLLGPTGKKVMLMQQCGGGTPVSGLNISFDDSAGSNLPDATVLSAGTFRPSQYGSPIVFPAPAPVGPYASALSEFVGETPNGSYSLWIVDHKFLDSGSIANGWTIDVTSA